MPGQHKTVKCPTCGMETRSNNLKRHVERMHPVAPEVAPEVAPVAPEVAPVAPEVAPEVAPVAPVAPVREKVEIQGFGILTIPSPEDVDAWEAGKPKDEIWTTYESSDLYVKKSAQIAEAEAFYIDALSKSIQAARHRLVLEIKNDPINQNKHKKLRDRIYASERELLIAKGEIPSDPKPKSRFRNGIYY